MSVLEVMKVTGCGRETEEAGRVGVVVVNEPVLWHQDPGDLSDP